MKVTRCSNGDETWIEPPIDQTWTNRKKLEWHAAIVEHDTGVRVRIGDGSFKRRRADGRWIEDEPHYSVNVGSSSTVYNFRDAWVYLNGVSAGAQR